LVARTARVAFEGVPARLERMGQSLGLSRSRVFFSITLPLARRGLLAAGVLGFSRALGEFGATVVVAGSIPGETQTLALAIFDEIQVGRDERALALLAISTVLAFAGIFLVERLLRDGARR
jgi:molybdate transport system permease protein